MVILYQGAILGPGNECLHSGIARRLWETDRLKRTGGAKKFLLQVMVGRTSIVANSSNP